MNPTLKQILDNEFKRQHETLDLIPSENYSSKAVREAVGSVAMHKYSEGYPNARYYEGNEYIDQLESLCIEMMKKVFKLPDSWNANVQPLAGSNANLAVYNALLEPGDKILSMFLSDGGHLSHGWSLPDKQNNNEGMNNEKIKDDTRIYRGGKRKVNIVSKFYNVIQYRTNPDTNLFDYDFIEQVAVAENPKLIITGGTAYARSIDYKRMRQIADKVGAYYLADVAHEAGLIAGGAVDSPVGIADVVTFTTHKTLRGPKGAAIIGKSDLIDLINKSIIPGMQGGPHNGTIAGITQALFEADTEEFREYSRQIVSNAQTLAKILQDKDFKLVSNGTDKHLILIDLRNRNIGGKFASRALAHASIIANMNTIPYDTGSPLNPSGLRIGTPTLTTRGMKESEMAQIAELINNVITEAQKFVEMPFKEFSEKMKSNEVVLEAKKTVLDLCMQYPLGE
jgi:glycine hydroxymethyltransferase